MIGVSEYLQCERAKPFVWGDTDCCSRADRWVEIKTGISPLARYGRLPTNEELARRWLSEKGGMVRAVHRVMRASGFQTTDTPSDGDVGIIGVGQTSEKIIACMAIFDGTWWHSRTEAGACASQIYRTAWRIDQCRKRLP